MAARSFQARLLFLLIGVMVLLQAATVISLHIAGKRTLRRTVAEELRVGGRVLESVLDTRAKDLSDNLRVLALDFPFREAVASGDIPTIRSVLANHGSRISADAVILVGLDGRVTTETTGGKLAGQPLPFPALLETARAENEASATVSFDGRPYQLVIVPVLAPRPIAWVAAGFEISESMLADVRRLTSLDISLWSAADGAPHQLVSTLGPRERNDLLSRLQGLRVSGQTETTMTLGNAPYVTLLQPLKTAGGSRVNALLQRSLEEAGRSLAALEFQIITLSTLVLLAAVIAAVYFARTVTKPLRIVAEGAARIERGDYMAPIEVRQQDEIGQLATAFNEMQTAIAAREDQIVYQATHDGLTGLPNRTLFLDRLTQAITVSTRHGGNVGMIMMDVDRFKEINDTLGHHFGDQLLIEIGRRLGQTLRQSDTVARLGGDEFAVMFVAPGEDHADDVVRRISSAFNAAFVLGDVSIDINASLGIALFPTHAEDADTLMKRADIAMYDAKKNHTGFARYEAGRDEHSLRRLTLMMELRQAVARDELQLYFQPKIDVSSELTVHAEALVRWNHPRHGIMRPDEFIPLAEQSGNIGLITKWVLRSAITQCAAWNKKGLDLTIAVNLSALDLFDSELPTFISGLVSESGLPAKRIVLEITESAVMKDPGYALKILTELKTRGLVLAIDDFGTGYSSLAHLKRLPVDELKIDKSFVRNLSEVDSDDLVIVRSTIELGHNMGMVVVAEGVETIESFRVLKSLRCDLAQGYLMSPPIPVDKFEEWLRTTVQWGRNRVAELV
jgi:diguanylate cyclase (GGDEF)-like protein